MERDKKSAWDLFKDGFKPMAARAKEKVREEQQNGSQYQVDMKKSKEERVKDFKKGFFGQ